MPASNRLRQISAALILAAGLVSSLAAQSKMADAPAIPSMVSFQGLLTDETDAPIDETVSMMFRIYRDSLTATDVWTETQAVAVTGGLFDVMLGKVTPLPDSIFSGQTLYLGVKVNSDPEMSPRSALGSTPYSFLSAQSVCVPADWYTDVDGDGFGVAEVDTVSSCTMPDGYAPNTEDCDDGNPARNPFAEEICDGIDNDCDEIIDSGIDTDDDLEDDLCDTDDDNDGVLDVDDDCPLIPGPVENNGCPV